MKLIFDIYDLEKDNKDNPKPQLFIWRMWKVVNDKPRFIAKSQKFFFSRASAISDAQKVAVNFLADEIEIRSGEGDEQPQVKEEKEPWYLK